MSVLFGDTFVDTNGVVLPSHTPTGANAGLSWSRGPFAGFDLFIQANGACDGNATFQDVHAVFNQSGTWPADVSIAFDIHFFSGLNFPAVTARHSATTDACYGASYDPSGGTWSLERWSTANPGVATSLTSASYPMPSSGTVDHMVFEVQGSALRLYKNGTLFLSTTDSTLTAAGKPGIYDLTGSALTATTGIHIEALVVSDSMVAGAVYQPHDLQHSAQHQAMVAQ